MRLLLALCLATAALVGFGVARRLPTEELGGEWRRAVGMTLLLGVLTIAIFLPVASIGDAITVDPSSLDLPDLFIGHYLLIGFLLAWWRLRREPGSLAKFLHLGNGPWAERLKQGVQVGVLGWLLAVTMNLTIGGLLGGSGAMDDPGAVPGVVIWFAGLAAGSKLAIIAMAMTVEEAFFRGFLQPRFGELPTSVLFALGHFNYGLPFLVIGVFAISLVLGRTFQRSGDLLPCIIAHGVFDAIQLFIVLPIAIRALAAT